MQENEIAQDPAFMAAYIATAAQNATPQVPFELRLTRNYLQAKAMLRPNSMFMLTASATPIIAKVLGIRFEESSKRYILTFLADGSDEPEEARSLRSDGKYANIVKGMFGEEVQGRLINHRAIVYKANQKAAQNAKMGAGYRVVPYLSLID